ISGIYKINNEVNGKYYVGASSNIWKRWSSHKSSLNSKCHYNKKLQSDWEMYGSRAFTLELLEEVQNENLKDREQYWINVTMCFDDNFGYNKQKVAGHSLLKFNH